MKRSSRSVLRRQLHEVARRVFSVLPRDVRHAVYRRMVNCDPVPDVRLELKIADTQEELEACFRLLHDAYVSSGFMQPHPSGLRVTIYHALPTTTTLCAKFDGVVVGTLSLIREGVFGFPMQSAFDLAPVRARCGQVAEVSALAVAPQFRRTGGTILFPLMKFMYEYCREFFDTRHLVIAVNPNKVELYESLLHFQRLQAAVVSEYDFANGAPAVGATLDLDEAPRWFRATYADGPPHRDLYRYFVENRMSNIKWPTRRLFTTNDPVMTPGLMNYFFNQRSHVFESLDDRKRGLLRSIYDDPAYARVLPSPVRQEDGRVQLRQHRRFSIRCPAELKVGSYGSWLVYPMTVIEVSLGGFQAECNMPLPQGTQGEVVVEMGEHDIARVQAVSMRRHVAGRTVYYGFKVREADVTWHRCVAILQAGRTHVDLSVPRQVTEPAEASTSEAVLVP